MTFANIPPTPDTIRTALAFISPDQPRTDWVKIGMAVKDALDGDGFALFDEWSKGGQSYSPTDCRDTWKSIKADGKITVGTLFYMAGQNGWKPNGEHRETEAERQDRERQRKARTEQNAKAKAEKQAAAASKAGALRDASSPALADHPYLTRKGIKPVPALLELPTERAAEILGYVPKSDGKPLVGRLLVALVEIGGKLSTAELIDEAGRKSAVAGGAKSGGYWTAQPLPDGDGAGLVLLIGEGVATALSCREATGHATVAALSAGNLPKIARAMRERYPAARLVILADAGNGQAKAEEAAKATGAALAVPMFPEGMAGTDFNDLHQLVGLDIVQAQISAAENLTPANLPQEEEKISENGKNPTLPTLSKDGAGSSLHQSCTEPTLKAEKPTPKPTPIRPGAFVYLDDDGKPHRLIESKAAKILANLLRTERYAWDPDAASWHRFDGSCWAPLTSAAEPERVVLRALFEGCEPVGFKQSYFNGVLTIMLRAGLIPLPPEPVGKIPFRNGLFDMVTRHLEPITPENAATWAIPHGYHAGTTCPAFITWIRSATGNDAGLIQLLRAFINACLTGRADLQKFLHLLGPGGTGKSTFIRLLFAMLGPSNCVTTDLLHLEQNRFETACLYGKRLAAITDSDRYGGSVNVLKAITGQDPVRNERKHVQQSGTFTYTGMVLIASNEPLASTDYTSGLDRRRLVVKFERRIPPEEKAAFMAAGGEDRLHQEIPAIINWALELSRDEVTNTFMHPPEAAVKAGLESLTAQNPIAEWITDSLIPDPSNWVLIGVREESRTQSGAVVFADSDTRLYPNYLKWCVENRREALALRRFRHAAVDMLRTMGADVAESRRGPGQGISGVKLRQEFESPHPWSLVQDKKLHQCRKAGDPTRNPTPPQATAGAAYRDFEAESVGSAGFFENFGKDISAGESRTWDYQNGRWTDDDES
jgi:putative DNA primase/helicase